MSIFTRAMGGVFIIGFSFVGIVYEHSLLPQTFSWSEFYHLNSVMPEVVLMSVFGFLIILGIVGFLSRFSAIVTSLIGLVVIFFELGAQANFIEITEKSLIDYYSG